MRQFPVRTLKLWTVVEASPRGPILWVLRVSAQSRTEASVHSTSVTNQPEVMEMRLKSENRHSKVREAVRSLASSEAFIDILVAELEKAGLLL